MSSTLVRSTSVSMMAIAVLMSGCSSDEELGSTELAVLGDPLPGISAALFAEARDAFNEVEGLADGLGPIFNERGCGNCHTLGAQGGAGEQIERRFGRFANGAFDPLANLGGTLRQLFTVGTFDRPNGQRCTVPLEVEPAAATVRNVGRLTTPTFGLGLVDAMPDSFFDGLAAAQPAAIRGIVNRVALVLPNPADPSQSAGGLRVGRFGWKAAVGNLLDFSGGAYRDEMGITTQSCINGNSVVTFATEATPNGVALPAGCDDLAPPAPAGVPAGTDDPVGSCAGGLTEIQEDVELFTIFMTFLAPTTRAPLTAAAAAGQPFFTSVGCAGCHVTTTFVTPANPPNGVPGNFAFNPFSDFLVHDMGSLGDQIGSPGGTLEASRRMRTAPLWGIRFRNKLLHDGRTTSIETAITAHDGQALAARNAFQALSQANRHNLVEFVRTL